MQNNEQNEDLKKIKGNSQKSLFDLKKKVLNLKTSKNESNANLAEASQKSHDNVHLEVHPPTNLAKQGMQKALNKLQKYHKFVKKAEDKNSKYLLESEDLNVFFRVSRKKRLHIIRGVDLKIPRGQIVGLVGESGSGKSVTSKAFLGVNENSIVQAKKMIVSGIDVLNFKKDSDWKNVRGVKIGYIPQDPLTSLNPTRTIGKQLMDTIVHDPRFKNHKEREDYVVKILESFGMLDARDKLKLYPHTFSGGMKQRVVIAMVIAKRPDVIIADEPTTALDPTVQASVLALLEKIRNDFNISIIFISHNISVVAKFCDYIYVMYAGKIVERGTREDIFSKPSHPYTWALISSIPENDEDDLFSIEGSPPDMANLPIGDAFAARNDYAMEIDFEKEPPLFQVEGDHYAATWLLHPDAPKIELSNALKIRIQAFKEAFEKREERNGKDDHRSSES